MSCLNIDENPEIYIYIIIILLACIIFNVLRLNVQGPIDGAFHHILEEEPIS